MKKFLFVTAAVALSATLFFGGCYVTSGLDGADGKDGKNATAYEYYELAKTIPGNENMTVDEFLREYLNYTPAELENAFGLQARINQSLLSAVSIAAQFTVGGKFGASSVTSMGSGVIVELDKAAGDAYVLTNCHVIYNDNANKIYSDRVNLYLYGQDEDYNAKDCQIKAEVIGASITYDVALLKVTGSDLLKSESCHARAAEFADGDDVYIGEDVYAIGNAEGYGMSATRGIVTKDREVISLNISDKYENSDSYVRDYTVVRTDAAINEGNSGGALFNGEGKIAALINSKASSDVEAMGFAIPGSVLKRLFPLMKESYEEKGFNANRPTLSRAHFIVPTDYTKAQQQNNPSAVSENVEISSVYSPAYWNAEHNRTEIREKVKMEKTVYGLETGDFIKHIKITDGDRVIEDRDVTRMYHLQDALLSARKGRTITLTVSRAGADVEIVTPVKFYEFD